MRDKAAVQAVVLGYLHARNLSVSELARRTGIPGGTLGRMLRDDPTYQGKAEAWARLARYPELHLDEAEVLAALGFVSAPPVPALLDPFGTIERALRQLHVDALDHQAIMRYVHTAAERAQASRTAVSQ